MIKEMQIKTASKYHFSSHQADNIQIYDNTSHWESCEEKKKSHTLLVRGYIVKTAMENNLAESLKTTNAYSLRLNNSPFRNTPRYKVIYVQSSSFQL